MLVLWVELSSILIRTLFFICKIELNESKVKWNQEPSWVLQNLEGERKGLNDYTISLISVSSFPNIDFGEPKFLGIITNIGKVYFMKNLDWF